MSVNKHTDRCKEPAMQTRCVFCKLEQYSSSVYDISMNNAPCAWCGKVAGRLTEEEYIRRLKDE